MPTLKSETVIYSAPKVCYLGLYILLLVALAGGVVVTMFV